MSFTKPVSDYIQVYDNYDKSFVTWAHGFRYKEKPILCVFASPERALAQVRNTLREKKAENPEVIPLPFLSIALTTVVFDHERYNVSRVQGSPDYRAKGYLVADKPQPIKLTYQMHYWTRNKSHQDAFQAQVITRLRANEFYLRVFHPDPIGTLICLTTLESMNDAPTIESAGQRLLRKVYSFDTRGWICFTPEFIKWIESSGIEIWKSNDLVTEEELLDTIQLEEES